MTTFDALWPTISDVGRHTSTGGYRRYAWSDADMMLREWFTGCAAQRGMDVEEDRNGNLWAWWMPPGWTGDPTDAFVTGSHLDSVPDGGAFDGPLGVVSAFAAVDIIRERGIVPRVPIAVTAFSDEEGARFGVACVGSQLSTGALAADRARGLRDIHGVTLNEAMAKLGRNPEHLGPDPRIGDRVGVFVELHVEQGRALDLIDRPVAVASAIWPHGRWEFTFRGEANHAGTTRLADRRDPMLAFASSVHAARSLAAARDAVATFGKVIVAPNGANAIPSSVQAWLDARAPDEATLRSLVDEIGTEAHRHAAADGIDLAVEAESVTPIVEFAEAPRARLQRALGHLGDIPVLPTQAGHDAGILAAVVPTAMLFVRNPTGVSHSPQEFAEASDCNTGALALADVMADWVTS
ncbi:allantoate amidohydrolase [Mycobacterium sp. NPDC048908]|uniref:allantoate amidohydrolase n=1 Tax=Mycobacterium sp. NPDC048908 TaxID=3364292 RepID=UPI003722D5D9